MTKRAMDKECNNPQCHRCIDQGVMYCCMLCAAAHDGGYSTEHTAMCDNREGINRKASALEGLTVALQAQTERTKAKINPYQTIMDF